MRSLGYLLVVFVGTIIATIVAQDDPIPPNVIVTAGDLGKIQGGLVNTTKTQRPFYAFHGIPYAKYESYTGNNRFQPPELWAGPLPPDPGTGDVFIANKIINMCPQSGINLGRDADRARNAQNLTAVLVGVHQTERRIKAILSNRTRDDSNWRNTIQDDLPPIMGGEKCLIMNINSPNIPASASDPLLPVILFVHGGGSDAVWGSVFTGLRLMEKDVVLVTINYRLGVLGSFNLGTDKAPGCGVLYDTITSLQWIKKYIHHFGGDPNRVTLSGQSAGAMISTHLLISPLAKGLFQNVWGFSGAALNVWATSEHPSLRHHLDIARNADCYDPDTEPVPDIEKITTCMKTAPLDKLVNALNIYKYEEEFVGRLGYDARMPSVQSSSLTIPRVVPDRPLNTLKKLQHDPVPVVLGATRHDGSYALKQIYENYLVPNELVDDPVFIRNHLMPTLLRNMGVPDESGALYHSLMHAYLGNATNTADFDSKMPGLIDMTTVLAFKAGEYKMLEWHAKIQPKSYFYSFDYDGLWTIYNAFWGMFPKVPGGICHVDDLFYIFYLFPLFPKDLAFSDRFVDYFVNFATYGDPNGAEELRLENTKNAAQWPMYDPIDHPCIQLTQEDKVMYNCQDSWIGNSYELFPEEEEDY